MSDHASDGADNSTTTGSKMCTNPSCGLTYLGRPQPPGAYATSICPHCGHQTAYESGDIPFNAPGKPLSPFPNW
eukprot:g35939.t1